MERTEVSESQYRNRNHRTRLRKLSCFDEEIHVIICEEKKQKNNMGRLYYMKHRNKIQILGLGLALALTQAAGAFAAENVMVGKAPGETAAQTETSAAQTDQNTSGNTVTAGTHMVSDRPVVLPAAEGAAAAAVEAVILQGGPGMVSAGTETAGAAAGTAETKTAETSAAAAETGASQAAVSAADIKQPEVAAEGAVLLNAATGEVLYGKNQDQQFYPASITKVMTALVVLEHCNLNETVTFSETATTNLESGAVALGVSAGDQLTVEQSLYGLLLKSANEIGNGLAEHVSGSVSAFADLMNAKAKELGCKNTHFANPHGLNNENHKTTPYDMALILRAAVANDTFRKIDTTTSYEFPAIKNAAAHTITMGHKMMYKTDSRYYEGIIGGKTGYTSKAGNTLVTAVERDGVRLIAVVMKAKGTHYTDTKAMLDYGFALHAAGKI